MKKILIAVDGSDISREIAIDAIRMLNEAVEVNLVLIIDTPKLRLLPQPELQEDLKDDLEEDGIRALNDVETKVKEAATEDITVNKLILHGRPSDQIANVIKEKGINHLYIGKSQKGKLDHLITGHTTLELVEKVKIPITIIPEQLH